MNKELQKRTEEWMQLERMTAEQRKLADEYYDTNLIQLIEKDFIERNSDRVREPVDNLVVSVGTSYEPIVLSIALLKPSKLLFLYTEASANTLDKVIDYSGLKASEYEKSRVNETNPIDIYREIKNIYLKWKRPSRMHIDFTGGTKAMSAACALAGAVINLQMIYISSEDYLVDFRKPNPGSEKLIYIENPLVVFGDLELDKAIELFKEYNFSGAMEKLSFIKENSPEPDLRQQMNFIYLLAGAYKEWDSLEFETAHQYLNKLCYELKRDKVMHSEFLLMNRFEDFCRQKNELEQLTRIREMIQEKKKHEILVTKEVVFPLMFTMQMNALTRESQKKLDMATLLFYRLLEMIEQRRLSKYNLFVSDMQYDNMKPNLRNCPELKEMPSAARVDWLKKRVDSIKVGLFRHCRTGFLPDPVSLLEGFILLEALRDPLMSSLNGGGITLLKRIRSMVFLRNNSIFAHGLGPVADDDYRKFKNFVTEFFQKFCEIERISYNKNREIFSWVIPEGKGN